MDVGLIKKDLRIKDNKTVEMDPLNSDSDNDNRNHNGSQTVRLQSHQTVRTSTRRKFKLGSISYLVLISLLVFMSSSPNKLCANAQEIIVGKPFPSPSPSPSASSSSEKSPASATVSPRPRSVAQNEWTPVPPSSDTKTENKNTDTDIETAASSNVHHNTSVDRRNDANENKNNDNDKDDKNDNSDLNSAAASHYVGRQITDPGFYSIKHPDSKGYAFAYGADDFAHQERRDGKVTVGEYSVALPDGRTQVVRYTSDSKEGFKADVSYQGEPDKADDTQQYYSVPAKAQSNTAYLKQQSHVSPSAASIPQHQISTPYAGYTGPSPTPVYRQSRISLASGPSPTPQSQGPSQSPIYLSYPIKAQRPSVSPSLLYSNKPHLSPSPSPHPNAQISVIDHHYYDENVITATATPPSTIYESDPSTSNSGPSLSPYLLKTSPSVETINRGTPLQFFPSASPSPNSLLYGSSLQGAGPTKITTILQRSHSKLVNNINNSPHYSNLPTAPSPSEVPSPYKPIPRGFRAGPEPEFVHSVQYTKTGKPKRILIHGPGGSPHPYSADSSNIRYKESKQDVPQQTVHHSSTGSHHHIHFSSSVGTGTTISANRADAKVVVKPKSNLVPIEFFKAGPATKSPVPAGLTVGSPLLQEQSISQKNVYSPNTNIISTFSPPLLSQAQEPQPQVYFQSEDAVVRKSHKDKYSPLHPQGGPASSSSEELQGRRPQLLRFAPNPNQPYAHPPQPQVTELQPGPEHSQVQAELQQHLEQLSQLQPVPVPGAGQASQQYLEQPLSVSITPVKSSVASYTIGHLGVTPKPSLYHSSTDPGIPVGRAVHPSVGGLVYLENPHNGKPPSIPLPSYSDELPDAGPTSRPTPKEQRKGVKEAISRLPFIPPFPPKTQTYKVGAPDFGDSVSYSNKPTSTEEIVEHHHHHVVEAESPPGDGLGPHYQHVHDLPSNQLSHHDHDRTAVNGEAELLREYYVQKTLEGAPAPNYGASA